MFDARIIHKAGEQWNRKVMKQYGYKTKRAMFGRMKEASLNLLDEKLTIVPTFHSGLDSWPGKPRDQHIFLPLESSAMEIGAAVRLAFERCE
jgi:hypothetical protein